MPSWCFSIFELYLNRILYPKIFEWIIYYIYILLHKSCWMFCIEIEARPLWDAQRHWSSSFWLKTNITIICIFRRKSPQTLLAAEAHRQVFKNHYQLVTFWMLNVILMWVNTGLWKCNIKCLDEIKSKCKVVLVSNSVSGTVEKTQSPLDDSSVPKTFSKVKETCVSYSAAQTQLMKYKSVLASQWESSSVVIL